MNKHGFKYNVNDPKIHELYKRYKVWKGLPLHFPVSDDDRREFEAYLDKHFKKNNDAS